MKNNGFVMEPAKTCDFFIACATKDAKQKVFETAQKLRDFGKSVEIDHQDRSLKSQFKLADKLRAKYAIIIGEDEIKNGQLCVRNMQNHEQQNIEEDKLFAFAEGKL